MANKKGKAIPVLDCDFGDDLADVAFLIEINKLARLGARHGATEDSAERVAPYLNILPEEKGRGRGIRS
jgi:hypothetical protein